MNHVPVLLKEVIEYLNPRPGDKIIDATFGQGGHAMAILERIKPDGKLLGIEIDPEVYKKAQERFAKVKEIILVNANYADLKRIAQENNFLGASGILFDIGLSSWHLEKSKRGFTFLKDELLDMRFKAVGSEQLKASEIINTFPPQALEKILTDYGEEKLSKAITDAVVQARKIKPITGTFQLIEIIKEAVPLWYRQGRIHFATKTFQALRIAVNNELENLRLALGQIPEVVKPGGKAAVISFHSLEDRIIKKIFKELKESGLAEILTKKPVRPSLSEITQNPRSRSAKLRVIQIQK